MNEGNLHRYVTTRASVPNEHEVRGWGDEWSEQLDAPNEFWAIPIWSNLKSVSFLKMRWERIGNKRRGRLLIRYRISHWARTEPVFTLKYRLLLDRTERIRIRILTPYTPEHLNGERMLIRDDYSSENYPLEIKYRLQQANTNERKKLLSKLKCKERDDHRNTLNIKFKPGDLTFIENNDYCYQCTNYLDVLIVLLRTRLLT